MEHDSDIDWTTDEEQESPAEKAGSSHPSIACNAEANTGNGEASSSRGGSCSKLINHFVGMGFSKRMVLKAIEENGEGNTESILNALLTYSTLEDSPEEQLCQSSDPSSSSYNENFMDDFSDYSLSDNEAEGHEESLSEEQKRLLSLESTGSLTENDITLLNLANMGYPLEEAIIAVERCGPGASISDLIDCILAAQISREADCYMPEEKIKVKHIRARDGSKKKRKFYDMVKKKDVDEDTVRLPHPMIGYGVPNHGGPVQVHGSLPQDAVGPPYFYYENVALAPKGAWDTISRHLYEIQPEFVDSKYFCAAARKRGYVHNLPVENRFPLRPLPPLTIEQAFPMTKRWWPSWDERDKLNCLQTAYASAALTQRIRSALERHDGDPPESVQKYVLYECRKWNLVWVGKNKVAPLEPDEVEKLLGFPKDHTRGGGISRTDRYKSLGNSFQVDTVAYHLSVLKGLFPNGINVLSLFSGIGGGEVALHRLGVKLKNVVSIEKSKVNRDIMRSWWEQTNQSGHLIHFDDVQKFAGETIDHTIEAIDGVDLVIGGSPCNNLAGSNRVSREGLDGSESVLFYDYVRILNDVMRFMRHSHRRR